MFFRAVMTPETNATNSPAPHPGITSRKEPLDGTRPVNGIFMNHVSMCPSSLYLQSLLNPIASRHHPTWLERPDLD